MSWSIEDGGRDPVVEFRLSSTHASVACDTCVETWYQHYKQKSASGLIWEVLFYDWTLTTARRQPLSFVRSGSNVQYCSDLYRTSSDGRTT
jgi:hypothetical protein